VAVGGRATQEGHILGTVAYMSPEQAEGKPVDPRSDVFSLGILLYEMITGERPFQGATQISTITAILRDPPRPVSERKHSLPRQLDRILQRCLEKDPERRYETARGLRNDLESLRSEVQSQPRVAAATWEASAAPPGAQTHASTPSQPPGPVSGPGPAAPRRRPPAWMLAAGLAVVLGGAWLAGRQRDDQPQAPVAPAAPSPSTAASTARTAMIVVFPFENLGPAEDAYFAAGIAEEITSRLATLPGLGVLSRTSAVQYDRTGRTMPQVAADLGVDYVLDGTVRWARRGDGTSQVRITPQLTQARGDVQIWSNSYDRSMDEIFRIQSEIAGEVVERLGMTLVPNERQALDAAPTSDVEAYHDFLRAHATIEALTWMRDEWTQAIDLLDRACARDPQFLRAHAELGKAHAGFVHFAWDTSAERVARSKAAVDRAMAIDSGSAWAQWSLGYYYYWGRKDYENAFAAFSEARKGLPSSSEVLTALAFVRRRQGRYHEALALLQESLPLDPRNTLTFFTLGETYSILRRYDEARRSLDRAIALSPEAHAPHGEKSHAALLAGDIAGARAALAAGRETIGSGEGRFLAFWAAIGCRDYGIALDIAAPMAEAEMAQFYLECRAAARGWVHYFQGDAPGARADFERARALLDAYVREHPDEANGRSARAIVLAHLGQADEALREARMALGLYPATHDAWIRQYRVFDLAIVEILTGRHDAAIERLGELLAQPSNQVSVGLLQNSPLFDPLRQHPGFARLLVSS
jgi:TolB-like protein/Flp pilus assembly protein TadD